MTQIISGFPCVGKTYITKSVEFKHLEILDSDSSSYSWIDTTAGYKIRNPDFPNNYINHIKDALGKVDYILVSSHKEVLSGLSSAKLEYHLVYPDRQLRTAYLDRCESRGSLPTFVGMLDSNWDIFLDDLEKCKCDHKFILNFGEHLSDYIKLLEFAKNNKF